MLFRADEFFFPDDVRLYIFEVAGIHELKEVISVKVGGIAVMPQNFQFPKLFIKINIIPQNSKMHFF